MSGNQQALLMGSEGGATPSFCIGDPYYTCGSGQNEYASTVLAGVTGDYSDRIEGPPGTLVFLQTTTAASNQSVYSLNGGATWQLGTPGAGQWRRLVWTGARFVAGSGNATTSNTVRVSVDGVTWSAGGNLPSTQFWYTMTYANGVVIAIAHNSTACAVSSTDGTSWTARSMNNGVGWDDVAYSPADNRWVAVARSSTITNVSTNNGTSWALGPALPATMTRPRVTYGGGKIVCATPGSGSVIYILDDGASAWRTVQLPVSAGVGIDKLRWTGTRWFALIGANLGIVSTNAEVWDFIYLSQNYQFEFVAGGDIVLYVPGTGRAARLDLSARQNARTALAIHADTTTLGSAVQDSSNLNATPTIVGTVSTSIEQAVFGQSMKFNGLISELISFPANANYAFGTNPFTIEAWFYLAGDSPLITATRNATIVSTWPASTGWSLQIVGTPTSTGIGFLFEVKNGGVQNNINVSATLAKNRWYHVAVCRAAGTLRIFLDGVAIFSAPFATAFSFGSQPLFIGRNSPLSAGFEWPINGFIDEVRITNGVGRYTTDFTVPTAPFSSSDPSFAQVVLLVHFDAANLPDTSCYRPKTVALTGAAEVQTSVVKFGTGAVAIPNTGASSINGIEILDSTDFDFGTADFTLSFWAYRTSNTYLGYLCYISTTTAPTFLTVGTDGNLDAQLRSSGGTQTSSGIVAFPLNQWVFVSLQRIGTNWVVGINGTAALTLAITGGAASTVNTTGNWFFGRTNVASAQALNGYIDEIRIWRNIAAVGNPPAVGLLPFCDSTSSFVTSGTERLVGQQAATAQGTLRVANPSVRLSGQQMTSSAGTVVATQVDRTVPLTGLPFFTIQASVSVFTPNRTAALVGQAVSSARGSLSVAPYPDLLGVSILLPEPQGAIGIYPDGRVTVIVSSTPEYTVGEWIAPSPHYAISSIAGQYQVRAATVFSGAVTNPTPIPYNLSAPAYFSYAFGASFSLFIQPTTTNPRYGESGYYGTIDASPE